MRICIEIKDTRTKHLRLFVDFLRHWFSSREIESRLSALALEQPGARLPDLIHLRAALDESAIDSREPFLDALSAEEERCLEACDWEGLAEASARLVAERGLVEHYLLLVFSLRMLGRYQEALHAALEGNAESNYLFLLELSLIYAKLGEYEKSLKSVECAMSQCLIEAGCMSLQREKSLMDLLYHYMRDIAIEIADRFLESLEGRGDEALEGLCLVAFRAAVLFESNLPGHQENMIRWIRVMAGAGARGLSEGVRLLRDWMMGGSHLSDDWIDCTIREIIWLEFVVRGAVPMARQIGQLRSLLEERPVAGALAGALTGLTRAIGDQREDGGVGVLDEPIGVPSDWPIAVPILENALGDMEECKLPLQVLSVAVRHAASGDETVLLELPRELRSLITQDAHRAAQH
jgi:tetratricopeptide (TPR) repeat protein